MSFLQLGGEWICILFYSAIIEQPTQILPNAISICNWNSGLPILELPLISLVFQCSISLLGCINKPICLMMRVTRWLSVARRSLVLQTNWTTRIPRGCVSSVFWVLNVALIEQFITPDHCQITGQATQKALKMPRKRCQAQSAKCDWRVCHSGISKVLFYVIL